jgi:amidase
MPHRRDESPSRTVSGLSRRTLLRGAGTLAAAGLVPLSPLAAAQALPPRAPNVPAPELEEATVADLQASMTAGRTTSRALAEAYLARIEALDRAAGGPRLRSVLEINPDALALADALDAERRAKGPRGPLHGIPVLIKDNIDTADRMTTTAGSLALEGSVPAQDATVAARLRAAGALLLGKTNLSEWANFRSTNSSSGWSGRGGQCRNPYALDRSPSGSSSGSGAAVAASLAAVAVGTETDGSIVSPSGACGLVGIKPTLGLVSRAGIIPIAHSQDTAGPMARTVADAAALLTAIAGDDPRDPETRNGRGKTGDYTRFLDPDGLRGARLGVARKPFFGRHPGVDKVMDEALAALKAAGAELVDPADIPHVGEYDDSEYEVLLYEFKADLNAYLQGLGPASGDGGGRPRTLKELIAWNERHSDREMPYFGQEIFVAAEAKGPLTDEAYRKALEKNRKLARTEGIEAVLKQHRLDAVIAPTNGPAWLVDLVNGDSYSGGSSSPAAVAGTPAVTVPAGFFRGLPVGLTFMGGMWSEGTLIKLAYAFERATKARRAPRYLPSADLGA